MQMKKFVLAGATCVVALGLTGGLAGAQGGKTVSALAQSFSPATVTIQDGQRVTWKNVEGTHTVTMRKGPFSKALSGTGTVRKTFKKEGTFRYYCIPHETVGMKGKVVVK
jgi:plastocyanin